MRRITLILIALAAAVLVGLVYFRTLHQRAARLQHTQATEEQERREVIAPPISTPTDVKSNAQLFWVSTTQPDQLAPVTVQLPLSADPVERAKQLIEELIANPPSPAQRTLPTGATLLNFYILPDGTAVADFSDEMASEMPSGILSEWMAVSSLAQTLGANVPSITRLKILIHGQGAETLAGHIDLSGFFEVRPAIMTPAAPSNPPSPAPSVNPPAKSGAPQKPKSLL
ncbi:MAG TPA: GerMN domain-containing protein [Candidatus Acidoferrales bacterium]|nr:GerMN domain-containing protein [Candidatus Acidoferrales bacterium]